MATMTSISSSEVAKIYQDNIWKIHSIPKKIISNRGPQFTLTFMEELCKALGIKRAMSTAYHPQTDGQTERINQEVKVFLRHYINYRQDDWTKWLAIAELQYNDKEHAATGYSLFYVNYGRHPWKENLIVEMEIPSLENLLKKMETVTNFIRPYLHQFSIDSHSLNGYGKPLKRPFDRYQSCLEAINNGRDIRQINW